MSSKKHYIGILVTAVAALLVFSSVAYAAYVTINTDNTVVDNWSAVPVLYNDGGDVTANYDIADAWMGNDAASPSEFYFRVNLQGTGRLPIDSVLEARLDCNRNGFFNEAVDITIYYWITSGGEYLLECRGDNSVCETNPTSFGEEILGTPNNYEWKADVSTGVDTEADWSACLGTVDIQFASGDGSVTQDLTTARGYSVPNVVTLKSFAAQNQVLPVAAIVLGVVAVGGLVVIRRRKGH